MKARKTLRAIRMLSSMQSRGTRAYKNQNPDNPPPELSPARKEELREIFNMFDEDNSGSVDANELKKLMECIGQDVSDDDIKNMIAGHISFFFFSSL